MSTNRDEALKFFHDLYGGDNEGYIEVRVLSSAKAPRQEWFRSAERAMEWIESRDRQGFDRGLYYGIGKRRAHDGGTKEDVLSVPAVWSEIDTDKEGLDSDAVIAELDRLPKPLRPSALIHSGHGLHLYWLLKSPVPVTPESTVEIERVNSMVQSTLGSDPIQDVSRVLRIPTTWNNRVLTDPIRSRLIWSERRERFFLDDLAAKWGDANQTVTELLPSLLLAVRRVQTTSVRAVSAMPRPNGQYVGVGDHVSMDELKARTRYHAGPGYFGIDDASNRMAAKLYEEGLPDSHIIQRTVEFVRSIKDRDAPNEIWDWAYEREKVRGQLERWKPKSAAIEAAKKQARKRSKARPKPSSSASPA